MEIDQKTSQKPLQAQYKVYETTRLFGDKELDAPRAVPASQEDFVAGLMAELDHDTPDGITVAVGPFSTKGTFAVPISLALCCYCNDKSN
eukprot:1581641-Pleurochrysis_carterae.AAC.1